MTDYKKKYIKYKLKYLHLVGGVPKGQIKSIQLSQASQTSTQASQASTQQRKVGTEIKLPPQIKSPTQTSTQVLTLKKQDLQTTQASIQQREEKEEDPKLPKRYAKTAANQEIDFLYCLKKNLSSLNIEFLNIDNLATLLDKQLDLRQNFTSAERDKCVSKNYTDNFIFLLPEEDRIKIFSLRNSGRQDNKIIFFNSLEEISILLYEISIIVDVFRIEPFNQTTLVEQLKNKIMGFNFKFILIDISIFVLNLSIFLPEYFKLLINLMNVVLGTEYDKVSFIDLKNFKYIALKLETGNFINNSFIVNFDSILITITQAWAKLFTLVKLLLKIFSESKNEIFPKILKKAFYDIIFENFQNFDKNFSKVFNELQRIREERVRQSLVPLCDQIIKLLLRTKCNKLRRIITEFKLNISNKKIKNQLLIEEFISIIDFCITDDFICSDRTKREYWKILFDISRIFLSFSTPDLKKTITDKMDSLFVEVQKSYISPKYKNDITVLNKSISDKLQDCFILLKQEFEIFITNLKKITDTNIAQLKEIISKLETKKGDFCPKIKKELLKNLDILANILMKNIGKSIPESIAESKQMHISSSFSPLQTSSALLPQSSPRPSSPRPSSPLILVK